MPELNTAKRQTPDFMGQASTCQIILLTGAPLIERLDWRVEHLASVADPTFGRSEDITSISSATSSSAFHSKWRSLKSNRLERTCAQHDYGEEAEFLSTGTTDCETSLHEYNAGFPDHSLAILDATTTEDISKSTIGSTEATMQSFYSALSDAEQQGNELAAGNMANAPALSITDLRNIPNAARLQATQPHHPAVNLLVSVIAIQPLRSVQLRRRNAKMDLIEVLVGDDTKAGFSITFWLTPQDEHSTRLGDLRQDIAALRVGELTLFSNIALSAYAGCVYGQSLSRSMTRNCTRIYCLRDHGTVVGLNHKIDKVAAWAQQFLRVNNHTRQIRGAGRAEVLPPDTPA